MDSPVAPYIIGGTLNNWLKKTHTLLHSSIILAAYSIEFFYFLFLIKTNLKNKLNMTRQLKKHRYYFASKQAVTWWSMMLI